MCFSSFPLPSCSFYFNLLGAHPAPFLIPCVVADCDSEFPGRGVQFLTQSIEIHLRRGGCANGLHKCVEVSFELQQWLDGGTADGLIVNFCQLVILSQLL